MAAERFKRRVEEAVVQGVRSSLKASPTKLLERGMELRLDLHRDELEDGLWVDTDFARSRARPGTFSRVMEGTHPVRALIDPGLPATLVAESAASITGLRVLRGRRQTVRTPYFEVTGDTATASVVFQVNVGRNRSAYAVRCIDVCIVPDKTLVDSDIGIALGRDFLLGLNLEYDGMVGCWRIICCGPLRNDFDDPEDSLVDDQD